MFNFFSFFTNPRGIEDNSMNRVEIVHKKTREAKTFLITKNQLLFWTGNDLCIHNRDYHLNYERKVIKGIDKRHALVYINGELKDTDFFVTIDNFNNIDIYDYIKKESKFPKLKVVKA